MLPLGTRHGTRLPVIAEHGAEAGHRDPCEILRRAAEIAEPDRGVLELPPARRRLAGEPRRRGQHPDVTSLQRAPSADGRRVPRGQVERVPVQAAAGVPRGVELHLRVGADPGGDLEAIRHALRIPRRGAGLGLGCTSRAHHSRQASNTGRSGLAPGRPSTTRPRPRGPRARRGRRVRVVRGAQARRGRPGPVRRRVQRQGERVPQRLDELHRSAVGEELPAELQCRPRRRSSARRAPRRPLRARRPSPGAARAAPVTGPPPSGRSEPHPGQLGMGEGRLDEQRAGGVLAGELARPATGGRAARAGRRRAPPRLPARVPSTVVDSSRCQVMSLPPGRRR